MGISLITDIFNGVEFGIRHIDGSDLNEIAESMGEEVNAQFGILISIVCFSFLFMVTK